MERIPIEKLTTPYKQKSKQMYYYEVKNVKNSKYIGNIMGAYRTREIVPADFYGKGKFYDFENLRLRGVEKYDEYLKYTYGNYMELPPVEKKKSTF